MLHFEKEINGTTITFDCPRNEGESTKDWAKRCKQEWEDICRVLEG